MRLGVRRGGVRCDFGLEGVGLDVTLDWKGGVRFDVASVSFFLF